MKQRMAVFIDRDGVINYDSGYFHKIEELKILPRVGRAIRLLNNAKIPAIVVTNQPAIAKGLITEKQLGAIHGEISKRISVDRATIDKFYYCPHHPQGELPKYAIICSCRKPAIGMFKKAAQELKVDLKKSFVVGDSFREIEAAKSLGCTSIAVTCGSSDFQSSKPDYMVKDLFEAVSLILARDTILSRDA